MKCHNAAHVAWGAKAANSGKMTGVPSLSFKMLYKMFYKIETWGELTETCIQHFQSLRPKLGTTDSGQKLGDDQVVLGLSCVQNGCHKACANYIG